MIKKLNSDIHQAIKIALTEEPHEIQSAGPGYYKYRGLVFSFWETKHNDNVINYIVDPADLFVTASNLCQKK